MTPLFIVLLLFDAGRQFVVQNDSVFRSGLVVVNTARLSVLLAVTVAEKELLILKKNNELIKIDLKNFFRDFLILFLIRAYFES